MLYLILNANKDRADMEIEKIVGTTGVLRMDAFSWDPDLVRGKLESNSLFGGETEVLVLDNISENEEGWKLIKNISEAIVNSEEKVVLFERDLKKEEVEFFQELKAEIVDLKEKKEMVYDFSPFALQDAVGEKSAKKAWIEYIKLRNLGIEEEEIAPKIIQKLRDMLAINAGVSKEALNIKSDYPYNKSKRDAKNWPLPALKNFYSRLVSIYHESRAGGEALEIALEKELLRI